MFETDKVQGDGVVIPIQVHPCMTAKAILINYPGYGGDIKGYNDKYVKIADMLTSQHIAAVVRMANVDHKDGNYSHTIIRDLREVIIFTLMHAGKWCGSAQPDIYLSGTSAGGAAVAAVAHHYPQVKKVLLVAPSTNADAEATQKGIKHFMGELFVVVGDQDTVTGEQTAKFYYDKALCAKRKEYLVIPNCDHYFKGAINGQIFGKAPLWAFGGELSFPSPDGGQVLYQ